MRGIYLRNREVSPFSGLFSTSLVVHPSIQSLHKSGVIIFFGRTIGDLRSRVSDMFVNTVFDELVFLGGFQTRLKILAHDSLSLHTYGSTCQTDTQSESIHCARASHRNAQFNVGCFHFLAYTSSMNSVLMLEDMLVIMLAALVYCITFAMFPSSLNLRASRARVASTSPSVSFFQFS